MLDPAMVALVGADRVAIAVSGGPDSMALLWLAARAWPARVDALTVDHGLRAESADEAAMVARVGASIAVPHTILNWTGRKPRANLPALARRARYRLMDAWCARAGVQWLMTGHHADDQAETVLMRLARGSGVAGLSGIRARRLLAGRTTLLRPLLAARKADLIAVCEANGLPFANDPTNRDPTRDRTAARVLLAATPWLAPGRLAAAAAHLADAEEALNWTTGRAWAGGASERGGAVEINAEDLPRALRLRLLACGLARVAGGAAPRGPDLARLLAALDAGKGATLAGARAEPGPPWRISAETP